MDFGCTLIFMPPNSSSNSREPNEREHLLEQESGLVIPIIGHLALTGVGDRHGTFLCYSEEWAGSVGDLSPHRNVKSVAVWKQQSVRRRHGARSR